MLEIYNYNAGKGDCIRIRFIGASGTVHNIITDTGVAGFGSSFKSICKNIHNMDKPYSKSIIIRKDADGREFRRELQEDSTGVREFFAWAVQIYRVVVEDKIVIADEMDRVLNPVLSDCVIAYINGMEHYGQFIFSTHNVLHLDLVRYMKEQIYFITKDSNNLISEVYSLADFPEVRYNVSKVYEFYMKGILGGTANE